jgi:pyrimidine operon attenuation protein/uracil phosphoribosyltransferase
MEVIQGKEQLQQAISKLAEAIVRDKSSFGPVAIVGIRSRGDIIAKRLLPLLKSQGLDIAHYGILDITLYRDDLDQVGGQARVRATEIDFDISDYTLILVDDVIFTGRTIRAGLDALVDLGRPKCIKLAVLVDRGGRELPIQPDYVGLKLSSSVSHVQVKLIELDQEDKIILKD